MTAFVWRVPNVQRAIPRRPGLKRMVGMEGDGSERVR